MSAKPTPARNLTARQWREANAMWKSGDFTYADLVKKFGKSRSSFERHFKLKGIEKGADAAATKERVEERLADEAAAEIALVAQRIRETRDNHYKMATAIGKLTWNEVLTAQRDGVPISTRAANIKTLDNAITTLAKVRSECWVLLGQDRPDAIDPDSLPELVVAVLGEDEIQEMRDRDENFDDTVNSIISEGDLAEEGDD